VWDLVMSSDHAAEVEILAGDLPKAEGELRSAYESLRRMGAETYIPTWAANLGRVICAQGSDEEALEFTRITEELTVADDITAQVPWRATRARIYARQGRAEEAEQLAREAVGMAERTDWLNLHAEVVMDLAEVLQTVGKPRDGTEAARRALELWQQEGNLVSAAKAQSRVQALEASI
jgi:tetratricopeptide (TPR) repeat protein